LYFFAITENQSGCAMGQDNPARRERSSWLQGP